METDPVCGKNVNRWEAFQSEYMGEIFFFCSKLCQEIFERQPELYGGYVLDDR